MAVGTIFLDMDGVLADFHSAALHAFGYATVTAFREARGWQPGTYWLPPVLGVTEEEFWHRINAMPAFWRMISPYAWSDYLYQCCAHVAPTVVCTSPAPDASSAAEKVQWLQRWFGGAFRDYVLVPASHKVLLARPGALLIDDSDDNCAAFRKAGGEAIVFPQYWNSNHAVGAPLVYVQRALERYSGPARPTTRVADIVRREIRKEV